MNLPVYFCLNKATEAEVFYHLSRCDADFIPRLSARIDISSYAHKIIQGAVRFEVWADGVLVGLVAVYCNDIVRSDAYITSVSLLRQWTGRGIASGLLEQCIGHVKALGFERVKLEVAGENTNAIKLYKKMKFVISEVNDRVAILLLNTKRTTYMSQQRDYDDEIKDADDHQYAYNFDFDVMHPYMIKSFEPFFSAGSLLELGSFKGDFTERLFPHFSDVTCVEASGEAIKEAKHKLGDKVHLVHSLFEAVTLPKRYDNIVLTHVLEHLDDPVRVLRRVNDEWLTEGGRLFLVCPNANALSRQIAVKMGLITHNSAVTPAEAEHGHRCTYSLDTLERDAVAAGLKVVHRSGIFFKALANFQWDRLLQTDIVSREYLDGCYQLGQQYPDLCASIFLMCERQNGASLTLRT